MVLQLSFPLNPFDWFFLWNRGISQERKKAEGKAKAKAKKSAKSKAKAKGVKSEATSAFQHLVNAADGDVKEEEYDEDLDPDYEDDDEDDDDEGGEDE